MPAIIAEIMLVAVAACGVAMYLFIHWFSAKRLHRHGKELDRQEQRQEQPQLVMTAIAPPSREALAYLYHEQVRRFIDAKIDIIRSTAETQNRLLLLQAKAVCEGTLLPAPRHLEADGSDDRSSPTALTEHLDLAREQADRTLANIDEQIRNLPGPSLDHGSPAR